MVRFLGRLVLFFGLLAGIKALSLWLFQLELRQRVNSKAYKAVQFSKLQPGCTTVFIGSSRTYVSIIPSEFDSLAGRSQHAYNYGVSSLFAPHSIQLTEDILRQSAPALRYVCLELSLPNPWLPEEPLMFDPVAEVGYRARLWRWYDDLTNGPPRDAWVNEYALSVLSPKTCLATGLPYVPSLMLGTAPPARSKAQPDVPYDYVGSPDGYLQDARPKPTVWAGDMVKLPGMQQVARQLFAHRLRAATDPNPIYWADITRLLQLAKAKRVQLLFYLPNRPTLGEVRWLPTIFNRLPAANRVDIRPDSRFNSLFTEANTFNIGHLNNHGARQYTALFAEAFVRATTPADSVKIQLLNAIEKSSIPSLNKKTRQHPVKHLAGSSNLSRG